MRLSRLFLALLACTLTLSACGVAGSSTFEDKVRAAVDGLGYDYQLLSSTTERYVVFHVFDSAHNVGLNAAFGLPTNKDRCPPAPRLPVQHKGRLKGFVGAGPVPLICYETDGWRTSDSPGASLARANISSGLATAVCEEVYGVWACFD